MAIPKLLKTMRESLSGIKDNSGKFLIFGDYYTDGIIMSQDYNQFINQDLTFTDEDVSQTVYLSKTGIELNDDSGPFPAVIWYSAQDDWPALNFTTPNDEPIYLKGVQDPKEDTDAANKAYVDNNGGTFTATYGTTTYAEIVEAFNQGKTIYCYNNNYSNMIFLLASRPIDNNELLFYSILHAATNNEAANTNCRYCQIASDNTWSTDIIVTGNINTPIYNNITTEISSSIGYYRPIRISTAEPTSNDGNIGDIWIQYEG